MIHATFTIFVDGKEAGSFDSAMDGAKLVARAVQQTFKNNTVVLRRTRGPVNVRGNRIEKTNQIIANANTATRSDVVVMATDDDGKLVGVSTNARGLLVAC